MDIGNIFEEWDFSGTVPLPYRVLLMGCIGIFAWASNLHILTQVRVDISNLLFSSPPLSGLYTNHPRHSRGDKFVNKSTPVSALYRSIYALGCAFLGVVLLNMWMYKWVMTDNSSSKTDSSNVNTEDLRGGMGVAGNPRTGIMVPIFGYITVTLMIFIPFNILFKKERHRFLRSMKKALFSGFKSEVTFSDVILADILTSFARVFGDLTVALCLMFLDRNGTNGDSCYGSIMVPIMTSIPYCIRLRQCLSEYIESNYTTERHLMNALKYSSAFPVIIISSMQKSSKAASLKGQTYNGYFSDSTLFKLWLLFVAVNSFYSFYWDIYHDWNLIQTQPSGNISTVSHISAHVRSSPAPGTPSTPKSGSASIGEITNLTGSMSSSGNGSGIMNNGSSSFTKKRFKFGMRSYLHYEDPLFYIMAVILDFLLRTTWMLKLFTNIQIEEYEGGVFTMECLEVLRRWIWVIFRLEAEMVKRAGYTETSHSVSGVGINGGLVGELSDNGATDREDGNNNIMMEELEPWQK